MNTIEELIDLLTLERISETTFLGQNYQAPWGRVFGGQVLGQSLHAAYQTVAKDRIAHSMHAYFILGGQIDIPIEYEVDLLRDGGSFTTRRVVAKQNGKAIFNMSASFQKKQEGIDHQIQMPNLLPPEHLTSTLDQVKNLEKHAPELYQRVKNAHPQVFDFKPIERILSKFSKNGPPFNNHWFKTSEKMKEMPIAMHQQLLAYASDYHLLITASLPHRELLNNKQIYYTSLDHALWFHRDFKIDDWLLYAMDSPSASNSRGFSRGSLFNTEGVLVASVAQEGLIREYIKKE